ncbi:uncharacterized protein LOC119113437 [Pollicipes pollicipes]|uniref:uncharacterized protein LOC119113437 n=1 Tax=Pollicipes pollicipes TaxID=41117 RepID=UPI00188549C8|nr:uncharacterized protein LOC119113437 [Pollicipes pollicipes]
MDRLSSKAKGGAVNGQDKNSQLDAYCGADPLAIAMAQSGIQGGDDWPFAEPDPDPDPDPDPGPDPDDCDALLLPARAPARSLVGADDADGSLDGWLSSYYYTVAEGDEHRGRQRDPDDPPDDGCEDAEDDPDRFLEDGEEDVLLDSVDAAGLAPLDSGAVGSVLPRLVASLGWTDTVRRPPFTAEELAALAICSAPERHVSVAHVAAFVRREYPFFRQQAQLQTWLQQALLAGARPAWQEDHCYAAPRPPVRRIKLATKT